MMAIGFPMVDHLVASYIRSLYFGLLRFLVRDWPGGAATRAIVQAF